MRARLVTRLFAAAAAKRSRLFVATLAAFAVVCLAPPPASAVTPGPSCGERLEKNDQGVTIKILFAKNGAVQQFVVVDARENTEAVHDMELVLEKAWGPAGADAPPLHIVSFKQGGGGMMVPDKAVDSCGRTLSFQ